MFIGHYAVGLAAKKMAPKTSLGLLFLSAQFIDLLWPIFLLLGWEHVRIDPGNTAFTPLDFYDYPISHSLLAVAGWAIGLGFVYYAIRRYQRGAWILAIGVLSHWLLDFISHRPDLPLAPGSTTLVGLGLWNSYAASILVELALFAAGIFLYLRTTVASDRIGRYAFWSLVGFLFLIWTANLFSPPPPNVQAIGISALALWVLIPWGFWINRHRSLVEKTS
jgi:hypothetical protein